MESSVFDQTTGKDEVFVGKEEEFQPLKEGGKEKFSYYVKEATRLRKREGGFGKTQEERGPCPARQADRPGGEFFFPFGSRILRGERPFNNRPGGRGPQDFTFGEIPFRS